MNYEFSSKTKRFTLILMAVGFLSMLIGFFTEKDYLHGAILNEETGEIHISYHEDLSDEKKEALKQELITHTLEKHHVVLTLEEVGHHHDHADGEEHGDHAHHHHGVEWHGTAVLAEGYTDSHGHGAAEAVMHCLHEGEVALPDTHHKRFWSNLTVNSFFFFGIALGALFFLALQYATEAAWATLLKRIFEAVMSFLPVGSVMILLVLVAGALGLHHVYHWMDSSLYDPADPHYDSIIAGKQGYLNPVFFFARTIIYLATFYLFYQGFIKRSRLEDEQADLSIHFTNYKKGALFLVFFAVFSTTMSWDWIMSIDTHWFSTLFGWYAFSGIWISAMVMITLVTLHLKRKGLLEQVNDSHIHDLGKWVFAISFLWSYLWFSQFMLIWYSNIPEEVTYYVTRINDYRWLFFGTFAVNFIFPMVLLMSREAKRSYGFLTTIGSIIFVGHWMDVFLMVMPGTVFEHWHIGALELGMFLLFLGVFLYVVLNALSKAPLVVKNHPYLEESLHHHI